MKLEFMAKAEYVYYSPELDEIRCIFSEGEEEVVRNNYTYLLLNNTPENITKIEPIMYNRKLLLDYTQYDIDKALRVDATLWTHTFMCNIQPTIHEEETPSRKTINGLWKKFRAFLKGETYEESK